MQDSHVIAAGALAIGVAAIIALMTDPGPSEVARAAILPPVTVGAPARPADVYMIERPGLYGLGPQPAAGQGQYAIVADSLVRLDPGTMVVRSVIRRGVHRVTGLSP